MKGTRVAIRHLRIEKTAYYALQEPAFPTAEMPDLLLVLHGYGQQAEKFLHTFAPLQKRNLVVVAPQASNQFYLKLHPKIIGSTWLTSFERDQAIEDFVDYMAQLYTCLKSEVRFNTGRVFVLGFSQGVSMAYRLLVAQRIPVSGLIACSADLPPDVVPHLDAIVHTPVLLVHGNDDSIVPREESDKAEHVLHSKKIVVEKYLFPGGHAIPGFVVEKVYDWCKKQV
ncbi:MAG: hypothetical protein DWQ10_13600 [Calditrichaeota bacterium]|nr:MAG: hypothetical protein DWQ10_13600 [Calditrichota bacterium]